VKRPNPPVTHGPTQLSLDVPPVKTESVDDIGRSAQDAEGGFGRTPWGLGAVRTAPWKAQNR
jgi:hypothetical protein